MFAEMIVSIGDQYAEHDALPKCVYAHAPISSTRKLSTSARLVGKLVELSFNMLIRAE
jgi:hypothetical protein